MCVWICMAERSKLPGAGGGKRFGRRKEKEEDRQWREREREEEEDMVVCFVLFCFGAAAEKKLAKEVGILKGKQRRKRTERSSHEIPAHTPTGSSRTMELRLLPSFSTPSPILFLLSYVFLSFLFHIISFFLFNIFITSHISHLYFKNNTNKCDSPIFVHCSSHLGNINSSIITEKNQVIHEI